MPLTTDLSLALVGRRIAVPESRQLDVFAALLERRGAEVLRCPLIDIRDAPDPVPVLEWLRGFCAGSCDDLILFTGEGLRRLLDALERHAPELRTVFVERLGAVRTIARGPKPGQVLRELGLKPQWVAEPATTAGVIALLQTLPLRDRHVGVQLYGSEPNATLMDFLTAAGAQPLPVAPYVYADAAADDEVLALIERMSDGDIDAIAFTSMQQVTRLFRVAADHERGDVLRQALARTLVAAVGPRVAESLLAHGITPQVTPEGGYYLKPLTQALIRQLGAAPDARS